MWDDGDIFDGPNQRSRVNLSTAHASSSTSLLQNVKRERIAREQKRREEVAALTIQKVWRGRKESVQERAKLREQLEAERGVARKGRGLLGFMRICDGAEFDLNRVMLVDWVTDASAVSDGTFGCFYRVARIQQCCSC